MIVPRRGRHELRRDAVVGVDGEAVPDGDRRDLLEAGLLVENVAEERHVGHGGDISRRRTSRIGLVGAGHEDRVVPDDRGGRRARHVEGMDADRVVDQLSVSRGIQAQEAVDPLGDVEDGSAGGGAAVSLEQVEDRRSRPGWVHDER